MGTLVLGNAIWTSIFYLLILCVVFSGISEMLKTPANERKRRSVIGENDATKTPVGGLATSMVEPSVLNTPEEPGKVCVVVLFVSKQPKHDICSLRNH